MLIACRLKLLDSTLSKVDKLRGFIADQEVALAAQDGMTSDPRALKTQKAELEVKYLLTLYHINMLLCIFKKNK